MIGHAAKTVQRGIAETCAQAFREHRPVELFGARSIEKVAMQRTQRRQIVGSQRERMHGCRQREAFEACLDEFGARGRRFGGR